MRDDMTKATARDANDATSKAGAAAASASGAPRIHPTAVIDPTAELDSSVQVGPYALIGPGVQMGPGCVVDGHALIEGPSTIGADNRFHAFCSVGSAPQDKSYRGEPTRLEMGSGNTIREYVTINRGTMKQEGITRIGDDNWIMACAHVAHDCTLGSHIVIANTVNLAGHVTVGDWVVFGGYAGVHQFCQIGDHVMVGPSAAIRHDVPPYLMVNGNPTEPHGINSEGLRRRGFTPAQIDLLKRAYKVLYRSSLLLDEARATLRGWVASEPEGQVIAPLSDFLDRITRGIIR